MTSFCFASNLKRLLQNEACPPALHELSKLLEKYGPSSIKGTLFNDIRSLEHCFTEPTFKNILEVHHSALLLRSFKPISLDIWEALNTPNRQIFLQTCTQPRKARFHLRYDFGGLQYSTDGGNPKDSIIFFQEDETSMCPAKIREIFSIVHRAPGREEVFVETYFFAVHKYLTLPDVSPKQDPFTKYPDFRAGLWLTDLSREVVVLDLSQKICHAVGRPWIFQPEVQVLRPLDRVSAFGLSTPQTLRVTKEY